MPQTTPGKSLWPRWQMPSSTTVWEAVSLFGFMLFFLLYGVTPIFGGAGMGLVGADEPRYAQVAREMLARHDWITPTLGGKPWLEKPPLYYWQAMLAFSIFENAGMSMGIMPIAGIPLPFLSYGGSATVAFFAAVGVALSVHFRHQRR